MTGRAPGWYDDPEKRHEMRRWDGKAWTEHVRDDGRRSIDLAFVPAEPVAAVASGPTATLVASAPTVAPPVAPSEVAQVPPPPPPPPSGRIRPAPVGAPPGWSAPPRRRPWYLRPLPWIGLVLGGLALIVVLGVVAALIVGDDPERIDAAPAAPPPPGFTVEEGLGFSLAVPEPWITPTESFIQQAMQGLEASVNPTDLEDLDEIDIFMRIDPATGENVNVFGLGSTYDDPREAMDEIRAGLELAPGLTVTKAEPADVHGFPAVRTEANAEIEGVVWHEVTTVVQAGDQVWQVTVTSPTPERASLLAALIVATFAPD